MMKFIFKVILLIIVICPYSFAETNIVFSERKVAYNIATQQKFPLNKSKVSSLHHSKPYISKGRSAIFRTILNPAFRSEKKVADMSLIKK